eukprot:9336939-Alexandrium_andersonii.AAC.1
MGSAGVGASQWNTFVVSRIPYSAQLSSPGRAEQADLRGAFRTVCRGWAWAPSWAPAAMGLCFGVWGGASLPCCYRGRGRCRGSSLWRRVVACRPSRGCRRRGIQHRAPDLVAAPPPDLRWPPGHRHGPRWRVGQRAGPPRCRPGHLAGHARGRRGQVGRQEVVWVPLVAHCRP